MRSAIALDAGNSKTDALLVAADGAVLARARVGGFRPQQQGIDAAFDVLADAVATLGPVGSVDLLAAYVANADLPEEEENLAKRLGAAGWAANVLVGNDTLALLRCGAPERYGVAVVCGAGINAAAVAPSGATARFPAVGELSGDWGGGFGLALSALWSAVRGEDGRGPDTALSAAIAREFDRPTALDVGLAVHTERLAFDELARIAPLLFAVAASGDAVATSLVERLAAEIAGLAAVLVRRLGLGDRDVPLVLGGGVLTARHPQLEAALRLELAARALRVDCRIPSRPPVYGAALLALDEFGADPSAAARLLAP